MDNASPFSAPRGDTNIANIGAGAHIDQIAVGENITQISGITADQVILLLDKIRAEYQSKPFDGRSPYVGLASFQERDADKFFGRETLTAELVTRVAASAASNARALFVAGPSGSGKSSLVRAGLIPALRGRKGVLLNAPTPTWLYETCKPGRAPLDELGLAVAKLARNSDLRSLMTTRGLTDATFLNQQADMALTDDKNQRLVLVIDQFEEIFTQLSPEREPERVAFLNLLAHAATVENGRVLVIFTLRSDFVSNCASYPNLNALVNQQFIQVGAMTPDELVSAIARPAYQVGLRIDPALISQIVNDVRGEPGALPLMQFALQDLFDAEKSKGELTLDGYTARGGLHQALERHADAEFAKLDDAEKQLARNVFSGLIEIGRGRADTKRTALFDELVPAGADESRVQALVRELADARLITTDEQDGKETVTLAHERLIDAWDWLRKLVDENRDAIALQNEIAQDAQEWETQERDESYLYRGARLATAQEKLQQNKLVLSGLAQEFLSTSITARRRMIKQRRTLAIGLGFALVLVVWWFFVQPEIWRAQARGESVAVPEGEFLLGAPFANSQRTSTRWMASVGDFDIDKYEVTNLQYTLCSRAQACTPPANRSLYEGEAKARLPVVAITLTQAQDYCHWLGRRVPNEAEWEWAAKGAEAWRYPTGDEIPSPRQINVDDYDTLVSDPSKERRLAVDALPFDKRGTTGLAGNVMEWTVSLWLQGEPRSYTSKEWDRQSTDLSQRVIARGGSWAGELEQAYSTSYYPANPTLPSDFIGVRCVKGESRVTIQEIP